MNAWIVVLAAGLGSYLLRLSMIAAADRVRMPARLDRATVLIAPAALAALAATGIASAALSIGALAPLAAVSVAVLAVARTGKPHAAILAGMPTLWLLTALLPGSMQ